MRAVCLRVDAYKCAQSSRGRCFWKRHKLKARRRTYRRLFPPVNASQDVTAAAADGSEGGDKTEPSPEEGAAALDTVPPASDKEDPVRMTDT